MKGESRAPTAPSPASATLLSKRRPAERPTLLSAFSLAVCAGVAVGVLATAASYTSFSPYAFDLGALSSLFRFRPRSERIIFPLWSSVPLGALFRILCCVAGTFRPSAARTLITGAVIVALSAFWHFTDFEGPFWHRYGVLIAWSHHVMEWVERTACEHQDTDRWRPVSGVPRAESDRWQPPQSLRDRWWWNVDIQLNPRGYGWSYEVKNLRAPPSKGTRRWTYILRTVAWAVFYYLLRTQARTVAAHLLADGQWIDADGNEPQQVVFYSMPRSRQVFACWLLVLNDYWSFETLGWAVAIGGVALRLWLPEQCPSVFGSLAHLYTVRNLWGKYWHQMMRRAASFWGQLVARDLLRLRKGSFGSRYVQLFVGFFVTGAIHAYPAYVYLGHDLGEWNFYIGQAAAIMFEDHIIALGKRMGFREGPLWRAVGFVWVVAWFSWSLPWWSGQMIQTGQLLSEPPQFGPLNLDPLGLDAWLRARPGILQKYI